MRLNNTRIQLFLLTFIRSCICGCSLASILYPLEHLSRQSRLNPYWLSTGYINAIHAIHQNEAQPPGLMQWTNDIFNDNLQKQQKGTKGSLNVLKSYISVFIQLLEYIMREKVEQELMFITDLPPDDIFIRTVKYKMEGLRFHIQIEHISAQKINQIDNTVHEIISNDYRVVVMMLPWEIGEGIIRSADQNYLINSGKVITWISFNMEGRVKEWKCIHNIQLYTLVEATYDDYGGGGGGDGDLW